MSSIYSVAILSNTCFLLSPGIDFVLIKECFWTKKIRIIIITFTKYWKQYSTEIRDKRTFLTAGTIGSRFQLSLRWTEGRTVRDYTSRMLPSKLPNLICELCFLGLRSLIASVACYWRTGSCESAARSSTTLELNVFGETSLLSHGLYLQLITSVCCRVWELVYVVSNLCLED